MVNFHPIEYDNYNLNASILVYNSSMLVDMLAIDAEDLVEDIRNGALRGYNRSGTIIFSLSAVQSYIQYLYDAYPA